MPPVRRHYPARTAAEGITERTRLERTLRNTQARYRSLYNNMLEGVAYCRMLYGSDRPQDFVYIDVNPAFERLTGLKGVVGKKASEVIPGIRESSGELFTVFARVASGGRPEKIDTHIEALDRWLSISVYNWEINAFVAIFDNITERKRREQEIEDLYQNAPCGYHSLDANGVFVRINNTELRWLGYTRDEVIGKLKMVDLLSPASRPIFLERFARFTEGEARLAGEGASPYWEMEMVRKDGTLLPVCGNSTAISDAQGRFVRTRTTINDMSATRKLEMERIEHLRRLEELGRRLVAAHEEERRILSAELHERTSPNLTAMEINLETILLDVPETLQRAIGSRLEDTCALLKDTAQQIREINTNLRPGLLDYAGLLPALQDFAAQFSNRTGIAVQFVGADPKVRLPPETESYLFRIAQEALTNCAKYSGAKTVAIELEHDAKRAALAISDDGMGFDPDSLGRPGHPAGLGIITMRERAEFSGGKFSIESYPGRGTRIRVEI